MKFIIKFLGFVLKEIFRVSLGIVIIGCFLFIGSKFFLKEPKVPKISEKTYVEIEFKNEVPESIVRNPFDFGGQFNFYGLLKNMDEIKKDKNIEGIILKLDDYALNKVQENEFKLKLEELKIENKKIYSYMTHLDNKNYGLAIESDKIVLPNTEFIVAELSGYRLSVPYYKKLSDKIGVKAQVIHIGDYKSFGENYIKDKMSEEFKINTKRIKNKTYNKFIEEISKKRKINKEVLNKNILDGKYYMSSANELKSEKLIDELMYYEDFLEKYKIKNILSFDEYSVRKILKSEDEKKSSKNKIGVLYLEGDILYNQPQMEKGSVIIPKVVKEKLEELEKDKNIKGIVVRIDSPGGSALASDLIYSAMKKVKKPIYISIGKVAASGGYYIAASGEKIYADKESITGSIGIVSIIPEVSELIKKIGINYEKLTNENVNLGISLNEPLSDITREKFYNSSVRGYNEFVNKMSESRKIPVDKMENYAGGRVWLGEEAKEIGLVDEIGGLEKTIKDLAKQLDLKEYDVVQISEKQKIDSILKSFIPNYILSKFMIKNIIEDEFDSLKIENELIGKPILYFFEI